MKVALVVPPNPLQKFTWTETYHSPLGLLYIASYLEKNGVEVKVVDCISERIGYGVYEREIKGCDIVGVTAVTSTYNQAVKALEIAKGMGKTTIIGGVHVSALPQESIIKDCIDFVVMGEGEYTTLELIKHLEEGRSLEDMKGMAFKNEGKVVVSEPRELIKDLDSLPFPARHLISFPEKYRVSALYAKSSPVGNVVTSRGCPYNCLFCASTHMWKKRVRRRSVPNVIEELRTLKDKYGVREIKFWDDTFTLNKKRVIKVCQEMVEEKLDFTWSCLTRVDHLEREMLLWMKKAGCWLLDFGIDSGNQDILNILNKQTTLEQAVKGVKLVKEAGIGAKGNIILGSPEETPETVRQTINFTKKLDLDYLNVCIMTPIPYSDMFTMAVKKDWIIDWNWDNYTGRGSVMDIGTISPEYLNEMQERALFEFYIRPRFILKRLIRLRSLDELQRALKYAVKVWRQDL